MTLLPTSPQPFSSDFPKTRRNRQLLFHRSGKILSSPTPSRPEFSGPSQVHKTRFSPWHTDCPQYAITQRIPSMNIPGQDGFLSEDKLQTNWAEPSTLSLWLRLAWQYVIQSSCQLRKSNPAKLPSHSTSLPVARIVTEPMKVMIGGNQSIQRRDHEQSEDRPNRHPRHQHNPDAVASLRSRPRHHHQREMP